MKYKFFSENGKNAGVLYFVSLSLYLLAIVFCFYAGVSNYILGWMAFIGAMYAVVANDSIQIMGTFIESRRDVKWYGKSLVFGSILALLYLFSWIASSGSLHFGRLDSVSFPEKFTILQLVIPAILILITGVKAPISTTFLILGLFGGRTILDMLYKSFFGYFIAFVAALIVWFVLSRINPDEYNKEGNVPSSAIWNVIKWISTAYLWIAWLVQDTANIVVFLPEKLNVLELLLVICSGFLAVSLVFISNGAPIQSLVSEKKDISNVKSSAIVDIVLGTTLYFFQTLNQIPLSTTWVFLGLLAGREIILNIMTGKDKYLDSLMKIGRDVMLAFFGIVISIIVNRISSWNIFQ